MKKQRTFYPTYRLPGLISSCLMLVAAFYLITAQPSNMVSTGQLLMVLFFLIIGSLNLMYALLTKMVISEEGIIWSMFILTATTTWSNIIKLEPTTINGITAPMLRLREPAVLSIFGRSINHREKLMQISLAGYDLKPEGLLYQELKRHA